MTEVKPLGEEKAHLVKTKSIVKKKSELYISTLVKANQIIFYFIGIVELLMGLRFILKVIGANPDAPFVDFIYGLSYVFAYPFIGITRDTIIKRSIFEWSTLIGMLIYVIGGYVLVGIVRLLYPIPEEEVEG